MDMLADKRASAQTGIQRLPSVIPVATDIQGRRGIPPRAVWPPQLTLSIVEGSELGRPYWLGIS